MKNIFKNFYKGLIIGLGIISAMIGGTYIYISAFSTLSTVNTGDTLTAQMWNDIIDRVSNIFRNSGTSTLETNGAIKIGTTSTCNTSNKGATRYSTTASRLEYCDGTGWNFLPGRPTDLGADATTPGLSCKDIYTNRPASVDGIYRIKPDTNNAVQVRCDMTNGGRTLVVRIVNDYLHHNSSSVGTITDKDQTGSWKIADSYINSISKTAGYKITCASETVSFSTTCNFNAIGQGANCIPYCADGANCHGLSNRGASTYPQIMYSRSTGVTGCRSYNGSSGNGRNKSGQVWVK